ncbi:hypothetical protein [Paenibacillus piscarius]|uniref:hypothetical protein n=1 Tax=Paenibacillus piscarius TaxID=1089681 RepID=UPI001EE7FA34|nr:hypothetical protein [Paenibacillus piscarius]
MSAESQLKLKFNSYRQRTKMPEQLDLRLAASFEQFHQAEQRENSCRPIRGRGTARIALVLCGLMLFGGVVYGAERLWQVTYGATSLEVDIHEGAYESAVFANQTRRVIADIQSQLADNESAMLLIARSNGMTELRMINRPQIFTDIDSWKKAMEPVTSKLTVPGRMPEGYHFAEGRSDSTVGITDSSWVKKYTNVLTKRLKPGEHYAWIKSFNVPNQQAGTVSPELVYQGPKGENDFISITYSPLTPWAQLTSDVGADTRVEHLRVNSVEALYVENRQAYENNSNGYYAYIRWIEVRENEERNMMVQVSTGSPEVTREMLLKVAEGLR